MHFRAAARMRISGLPPGCPQQDKRTKTIKINDLKGECIMPRGDRTGPAGMGPMTGRKSGFCTGAAAPGYANPANFAGGFGCGSGRGRGYRRMFYATGQPGYMRYTTPVYTQAAAAPFDEKAFLNNQAQFLENQLLQVKNRLAGLSCDDE